MAQPLPIIKSLQLLSGRFLHESIRNFAVKSLELLPVYEIESYLSQLIQALKYEMNHDSALSTYLLAIAIKNPLTLGKFL